MCCTLSIHFGEDHSHFYAIGSPLWRCDIHFTAEPCRLFLELSPRAYRPDAFLSVVL
jgi:hypothetical protein